MVGSAGEEDFAAIVETPDLTVAGSSRRVDIALDGEVTRLPMPLRFRSEPRALAVVAPPVVAPLSRPDASPTSPP
jgi:diacylglycerol kinase family enzyme